LHQSTFTNHHQNDHFEPMGSPYHVPHSNHPWIPPPKIRSNWRKIWRSNLWSRFS